MTTREALDKVLASLPEMRLCEVLDFARYLRWLEEQDKQERNAWHQFGVDGSEIDGPDEPEYTEADIKPELNR